MKTKRSLLIFLLFGFLLTGVEAQTKKGAPESALLYRITGKKLTKPSYIFGTIHLICPKDMFPADELKGYINQTEQLLLEIDLDDPTVTQKAAKGATLPAGKTVKDYLKPEEYEKIDEMFENYLGISYDQLQTYKPSLLAGILLRSPKIIGCPGPVAYDSFLAETATAGKLPINGLETVEAELSAIDSQSLEKQVAVLNKLADDPEKGFSNFKDLYRVYLTQSSDDLYNLAAKSSDMDASQQKKLLAERNVAWIPVIEKNIKATPSFIGVGGAHLGGPKGVLKLLRERGYILTPIKL
ncbi:MAG TPA: TraB/GumN family protein [Pyrinomonadaceae bacterium]|nr:TraB/GumN family protein [Pyrinomonadaceae bacterium]